MYKLILRKKQVELEFVTDDKEIVAKHLGLIIEQASSAKTTINSSDLQDQNSSENIDKNVVEESQNENFSENVSNTETPDSLGNQEPVEPMIDNVRHEPVTINSLQNPSEPKEPDFDEILNLEMNQNNSEPPILKDEKFIEFVKGKSAIEKLDFLVITAQYLAQYENMNTFNLKHINAKLMQNFTLIVDHNILQGAISRDFITRIYENNDDSMTEYMLTEKGLRSY